MSPTDFVSLGVRFIPFYTAAVNILDLLDRGYIFPIDLPKHVLPLEHRLVDHL